MTMEDTSSRIIKNWNNYCLRRQSQYNKICGKTQSTNLRMLAITFNMVKIESRLQTNELVTRLSRLIIGNESYSGKRIWCLTTWGFESLHPDKWASNSVGQSTSLIRRKSEVQILPCPQKQFSRIFTNFDRSVESDNQNPDCTGC